MHTIHKYELPANDIVTVQVREGARPLHVAEQRPGCMCLWAQVDTDAPLVLRTLYIFGTGEPWPDDAPPLVHLGSALLHGGSLVFHVFGLAGEWGDA